jgi:hypothetical protein
MYFGILVEHLTNGKNLNTEFTRLYAAGVGGKKSLIGGSEARYEAMVGF